jgi:hypothetical protein
VVETFEIREVGLGEHLAGFYEPIKIGDRINSVPRG